MMRIILTITITFTFVTALIAQESKLDQQSIKDNRIKQVTYITHIYKSDLVSEWKGKSQAEKYDQNRNLIWLATYDTIGNIGLEFIYRYDQKVNKTFEKGINHLTGKSDSISYFNTYTNGCMTKQERSDTFFTIEWTYDNSGHLMTKNKHNKTRAENYNVQAQENPESYKYNDYGNLIEIFRIDGDFKIRETFKYDEANRKTERKWIYVQSVTDTSGRVFLWERYYYDQKGNLIKEENIGGYGGSPTSTYTYDNNDFLIRKEDEYSTIEYIIDEEGKRTREILKIEGKIIAETEYQYQQWK